MTTQSPCDSLAGTARYPPPDLTPSAFVAWLRERIAAGDSRRHLGWLLGVTAEAIRLYLNGMRPSDTVLLLAGRLMREQSNQSPLDAE